MGLSGSLGSVEVADSYILDGNFSAKDIQKAAALLTNPVIEQADLPYRGPKNFTAAIEIGFLPGVTDNVGATARQTIADGLKHKFKDGQNTYSSAVFFISGKLTAADLQTIADSLYNPLIQRAKIIPAAEIKISGVPLTIPRVKLTGSRKTLKINLNITDEELAAIGKQGIPDSSGQRRGPLALDLDAMRAIRDYFILQKRQPTDLELESLAQTWSEHCKHTIFASPLDELEKGLYKTYIKGATETIRRAKGKDDCCVSVFTDNSGAIAFDDEYLITHKVETHNSPSALDPFGGSVTGIVGVNRDALGFGLGSKPIANFYGFCLADPADTTELYRDQDKTQKMLSAERIMQGVVAGINNGGNCSGIPTPLGFVFFDPRYRGKPLVFAGTVGLIPRKIGSRLSHLKKARPGDYIVMAGGRVGKDGIHGATFSSESLNSGSPATAVQIGDPITQKKLSDAIIREARQKNLYTSITDDGAGGLSSSVGEMAKESGGCEVYLDKVPLKYPGLQPWEIWISESQERMTLAVPKNKWKDFSRLMKQRDVEATVIGKFTNTGRCVVKYQKQKVMDMQMDFLHDGVPIKHLESKPVTVMNSPVSHNLGIDYNQTTLNLLCALNICSYEFISQQYDHEVQGTSVTKPLQGKGRVNAEAAVMRPVLTSDKGIILSLGLHPKAAELDPYRSAACSIDSAIRAAVAAGANIDELALLDNFCWCSSNEPERLGQLKQAVKACYDYATAFGTPFISGKDSMFNDFKGFDESGQPLKISIPPTLLISTVGVIPDVTKTVTLDAKAAGDSIYLLGETFPEFGGSELISAGTVPHVDAAKNLRLYRAFYKAVQKKLLASAISVGRGGLAAALSKMCIAGNLGASVTVKNLPGQVPDHQTALFSESQGRILVSINPKLKKQFEALMKNIAVTEIGIIKGSSLTVAGTDGKKIMDIPVKTLEQVYKKPLQNY